MGNVENQKDCCIQGKRDHFDPKILALNVIALHFEISFSKR